jgi:TonB-dependent receptor
MSPNATPPALALLLALCSQASIAAADDLKAFDIERQSLAAALNQFAAQSDRQILFSTEAVASKRTRGIKGELEPEVALRELLDGTGLTYRVTADQTILVENLRSGGTANVPVPASIHLAEAGGAESTASTVPATSEHNSDPQDSSVSEVVVTGFRESLQQAHALKRDAVGAEDVIVAEDIAAFPDLNLAESLQRIPGVTINRDSGEGRQITLRGLGPDFTRTQLNGMEVLGNTASGMDNRGGVSRTRSFDYSLFASELFDRVTVRKSYSADLDEGGIGGTVQLETAKPFDYDGFKAVLSAKGQTNSNTKTVTPRLVGLISDRWGDFGALASAAYSTNDSNEFGYRSWGWGPITVSPANIGPGVSAADAAKLESGTVYAPQADTYSTWFTHRRRFGSTVSLQYEPADSFKLGLDGVYSRLTNDRRNYALAAAGSNALTGNVSGTQVLQSDAIQGNSLVAANYTGVDMRSEFNTERETTDFYQTVLHGSSQITDDLRIKGLVGYSRSDYELPHFDKVFLESKNQSFGFDDRPSMPVNSYGFNVTDPNLWNLMRLDSIADTIINSYTNGKLDVEYNLNSVSTIEVGGEYKKFTDHGAEYNYKGWYNKPTDTAIPGADKLVVPDETLLPYVVGDVDRTFATVGQVRDIMTPAYLSPGSDYAITEETTAGYVQYDLNTPLWGRQLKANVGVRYYSTDLTSAGSVNNGDGTLQGVSIKHHYDGVLPALNIAFYVRPDLVARFSANRDISRPALSDLAAAGSIDPTPFGGGLSIGNPNLKPFTADSVEGSLEYYDGRSGFVSLGAFYKKMNSFISGMTTSMPYSQTGYPLSFLLPGQTGSIIYNVTQPTNVSGADIKGIEVAFQRDFDFLPAPLNHLGIVANGTYADGSSAAIINGNSYNLPLVDLSKYSANATLYYETARWGMRISEAYRGTYLDSIGANGNVGDGYEPTNNVDFAAHYNITPTLKVTLEALNLTDQHIVQFADMSAKRIEVNTSSGRTFLAGMTAEF